MGYILLLAALAAIALFAFTHRKAKSKHGFTIGIADEQRQLIEAEAETARQMIATFVEDNDSSIRDVLTDYSTTHRTAATVDLVQRGDGVIWRLRDRTFVDCVIQLKWGRHWDSERSESYGKPHYHPIKIYVRQSTPEAKLLAKAVEITLRKGKSNPSVAPISFMDSVDGF